MKVVEWLGAGNGYTLAKRSGLESRTVDPEVPGSNPGPGPTTQYPASLPHSTLSTGSAASYNYKSSTKLFRVQANCSSCTHRTHLPS